MTYMQSVCFRAFVLSAIFTVTNSHAQSDSYAVTERGADYAVHQKTTLENGTNRVHKYTELATGLNYTNASGQLVESKEEIDALPQGGAAATQGRHQAYFPGDIYQGVIEVVTPDGLHLKSRPMGISYDDGTNTVLIAVLTNSVGVLVGSNQVVYPNAFAGLKADLRYTYRKGGFEQDIVLREQPPAPESFGLSSQNTRLQMLTEFFNAPEPGQARMKARRQNGMTDTTLTFGKMQMVQGNAFSIGDPAQNRPKARNNPVYKSWQRLAGRTFLVEELPVQTIAAELEQLPVPASAATTVSSANAALHKVSATRLLPPPTRIVESGTNTVQLAKADLHYKSGVVLDYDEIDTGTGDFTFETGQTYYISSGGLYFSGTTTIEGGTVIKFPEDGWGGIYCANVVCTTTPYNPAVFTSANDNSVGDTIDGSSGSPAEGGNNYLGGNFTELNHCWFNYAGTAIWSGGSCIFNDCQFLQCYWGVVAGNITVNNSSVSGCYIFCDSGMVGGNVTFDSCDAAADGDSTFTNCIFSSMANVIDDIYSEGAVPDGSHNGFYGGSPTFGDNIVTGSIVDAGSVTADQVGLYWWTTQGPIEGTSIVDLGYHTPAVDGDGNPISTLVSGVPDYLSDANGNGLPDSWETNYFGNLNQYASELDPLGNTLLYDYTNGVDLSATVHFNARLGNQNFNTTTPTGSYVILSGVPGYEAVLVNDTNLDDAVWQPYDGNISLSLGSTDGVYQVWIGLNPLAAGSQPTWIGTQVTLNRSIPQITITSLKTNVVAQPYLQLQGYSALPLAGVTYDVSNTVSVLTNVSGSIIAHTVDTNTFQYTTDYFQCYDILLTNGMNTITLHATDPAGNSTNINFNVTLDYSVATNPAVKLAWPSDGMEVCGSSFAVRGWTEDSAATVSATVMDTNGDTNTVNGTVDRDGTLRVNNLPLADGTNQVTLWVTNSAGLSSATNFSVVKSSMTLTITSIDGDLWLPTVSVSGTISDDTAKVYVNGVQGSNYGNGTWRAGFVPVSPGGVASFDVSAVPEGGGDPDISTNVTKSDVLEIDSATWDKSSMGGGWFETFHGGWSLQGGGKFTEHFDGDLLDCGVQDQTWTIAPDRSVTAVYVADSVTDNWWENDVEVYGADGHAIGVHVTDSDGNDYIDTSYDLGAVTIALEEGSMMTDPQNWKDSDVKMGFHLAGNSPGSQVLVEGTATATEEYPTNMGVSYDQITDGQLGQLDTNGFAAIAVADGSTVKVTPQTEVQYNGFTTGPGADRLHITANGNNLSVTNPEFCVGQKVTFAGAWDSTPSSATISYSWALAGTFVNRSTQANSHSSVNWDIDPDSLNSAEPFAYWITGGNKNAYLNETLHFSNGQSVTVSASGQFSMFRPTASIVRKYDYGTPTVVWNPVWGFLYVSGTLQVGTGANTPNSMDFYGGIQSKYHGSGKWVQIIDVNMTGTGYFDGWPDINPSQTGVLDNQDPFGPTPPIYANTIPSGNNNTVPLDDSPAASSYGQIDPVIRLNISATDYLMFQPDGGIWVPLGKTTSPWAAHCNVEWPTTDLGTGSIVSGPGDLDNSTAFPSWTDTLSNP